MKQRVKQLKRLKNQLVSALLMVVLTVPLVLVAISSNTLPTLGFRGAQIKTMADGSIQLLFDVFIANEDETDGARFTLDYNPEYMVPSDYTTNAELLPNEQGAVVSTAAFQYSPDLYKKMEAGVLVSADPFKPSDENRVDRSKNKLTMHLFTDPAIKPEAGSGMVSRPGMGEDDAVVNVFNASTEVCLGTLSFRVTDPSKMPEITQKFHGITNSLDPVSQTGTGDYLMWFSTKANMPETGPWAIGAIRAFTVGGSTAYIHRTLDNYDGYPSSLDLSAQSTFTFHFPRTIIAVEAAEAELNIDAYRNYTNGTVSDLDATLQKYSPTVIVTYSDGSRGSFMMPWSRDSSPWSSSEHFHYDGNVSGGKGSPVTTYDPTHGDYLIEKLFCYADENDRDPGTNQPITKPFPVPVKVHLTVTPITLLKVTADDLHKSYILNNTLVDQNAGVQSPSALKLPSEARLITDYPPSGATLTMDIKGWSHQQENGLWPSDDTGTEMLDLWKDKATAADKDYLHWPTRADQSKWNDSEGNSALLGHNRAGLYSFVMADGYGGQPDDFTQAEIQAKYPWLTVPQPSYGVGDATRRIVWNEDPTPPGPDEPDPPPKLENKELYRVKYVSTVTDGVNGQPTLTLQVTKSTESGADTDLNDRSVFRVRLPDGTEIGVGTWNGENVTTDNWFANNDGDHQQNRVYGLGVDGNRYGYNLVTNPGDPTKPINDYNTERELLRRYINLGGWFHVAVKEGSDADGRAYLWSDFMPVYVPPRTNYYEEHKVYNFIASNADLFPWPNGIQRTVILPRGQYETVDDNGQPVYERDGDNNLTDIRATERYGVKTTYDGATGAQPGELNMFTIYPDPTDATTGSNGWKTAHGSITVNGTTYPVTQYGKNEFLSDPPQGVLYTGFGRVQNQAANPNDPVNYTATVRVQDGKEQPPTDKDKEGIKLTYVSTNGGTPSTTPGGCVNDPNLSVDTVIYNTKMEGYTTRQDYTLKITNTGDTDIYGLDINSLYSFTGTNGGHFVVLQPPAPFLPAGESTTFVLTYVYGLTANTNGSPLEYLDQLYITSNSHNDVASGDYLLDFRARFAVTRSDIHRVTVKYIPANGGMGTAGVIVGKADGDNTRFIDTNPGPNAFGKDSWVYIIVEPTEEYTLHTTVGSTSQGEDLIRNPSNKYQWENYTSQVDVPDGVTVYRFRMPDYDTEITVTFEEPIVSKLRLSNLVVYADEKQENLYDKTTETQEDWDKRKKQYAQTIWQKDFTDDEQDRAADKAAAISDPTKVDHYLMPLGKAGTQGFDKSVKHYLTVIPYDADYAQVEATLLKVIQFSDLVPQNEDLSPVIVHMELYYKDKDTYTGTDKVAYTDLDSDKDTVDIDTYKHRGILDDNNGDTSKPTVHTSESFDSPPHGKSAYVRVDISYTDNGVTTSRSYYVELHRAPKTMTEGQDYKMNYGNSPFGMIMNDSGITDKDGAKGAFVGNKYSFDGLTAGVPAPVTAGRLTERIHYWTEAWVAPDADYEPESGRGITHYIDYYNNRVGVGLYQPGNNLDLSDYAFFAIMGEAFEDPGLDWARDSSGRKTVVSGAKLSLEAVTLNTTAGQQVERFDLPMVADPNDPGGTTLIPDPARYVTLDLGTAASTVPADWADGKNLRPGRYRLAYTYPDYNHTATDPHYLTVERDFVVLAPVGDINADLRITTVPSGVSTDHTSDEGLVKGRVTAPLGYLAENYEAAAIFKLRTCDVNNDRNINNIDANAIAADGATNPNSDYLEKILRYYLPVGYK